MIHGFCLLLYTFILWPSSGKWYRFWNVKRKEERIGSFVKSRLHGRFIGLKEEIGIDYTYLLFFVAFSFFHNLWPSFPRFASAVHFFVATVEGRKKTGCGVSVFTQCCVLLGVRQKERRMARRRSQKENQTLLSRECECLGVHSVFYINHRLTSTHPPESFILRPDRKRCYIRMFTNQTNPRTTFLPNYDYHLPPSRSLSGFFEQEKSPQGVAKSLYFPVY